MYLNGTKILCIGDSITFDIIAPTEGAYRYYIADPLASYFKSNITWCGDQQAAGLPRSGLRMCGTSGRRIDQVLSTDDPGAQVLRWKPNLVIIHLGTNDMTQLNSGVWVGGSIAISIANMSTLLTTIFAANPTAIVAVCKIIPNKVAGADSNITTWNSQLETMVAAHANASRIFIPDINAAYKANVNWATDYFPGGDDTHPNSTGKRIFATALLTSIQNNITIPYRMGAQPRQPIKSFSNSLQYTASTPTILGTNATLDTSQPWAVSFWMDLTRGQFLTTNQGILCLKTDQATPFVFLSFRGGGNRGFEFGSNANFGRFFANVAVENNFFFRYNTGWHNFIITFNGVSRSSTSSYKLYLDGQPVSITSGSGLGASTNQNAIGAAVSGGVAGTFNFTDLKIWNGGTVMTAQQAQDFYYNDKLPVGPTLIRNYTHSDGSGTTLTDATGNQNGTIGTATWSSTAIPTRARTSPTSRRLGIRSFPYSMLFDGSGDYIALGNNYAFERTDPFSVCGYFIMNTFAGTNNQTLIRKASTGGSAQGWMVYVDLTTKTLHTLLGGTAVGNRITQGLDSSSQVQLGIPYFWALTYSGNSNASGIQMVCIPVGVPLVGFNTKDTPITNSLSTSIVSSAILRIGSTSDNLRFWNGIQQKISVFNASLSLAELQNIYYDNIYPASLASTWLGENTEGSGSSVSDEVGNIDGAITGASWSSSVTIFRPRS